MNNTTTIRLSTLQIFDPVLNKTESKSSTIESKNKYIDELPGGFMQHELHKKKTTIFCKDPESTESIYDMLISKNLGENCLKGEKICTDEHSMIPTMMEFELTDDEIKELLKCKDVISADINPNVFPSLHESQLLEQTCHPDVANIYSGAYEQIPVNTDPNIVPHSIYFCQNSENVYNNKPPFNTDNSNGTKNISPDIQLKFKDCSNVDIIIIDTGVDASHPDFLNFDGSGPSRVQDFGWNQLRDSNDSQIISDQIWENLRDACITDKQSNMRQYVGAGHGTSCASLAAGTKCGFAKNAKIYSLPLFAGNQVWQYTSNVGVTIMKLCLAFVKAKKNNLYGLDSSRPTIISNSWGYGAVPVSSSSIKKAGYTKDDYELLKVFSAFNINPSIAVGESGAGATGMPRGVFSKVKVITDPALDEYIRQILNEGGHMLFSAGNDNAYLDKTLRCDYHGLSTSEGLFLILANDSDNEYIKDGNLNVNTKTPRLNNKLRFQGNYALSNYSSPGIGASFDSSTYPSIVVGDVTTISKWENNMQKRFIRSVYYWEEANSMAGDYWSKNCSLQFLYNRDNDTDGIKITNTTRYSAYNDAYFVKTYYSNFGPDVDVYAPGNSTHAALSKDAEPSVITLSASPVDVYQYFNGTSAACPIVAGVLATYLSEYPNSTPLQAKQWLINNSSKGNILETTYENKELNLKRFNDQNNNLISETVTVPVPTIDHRKSENTAYLDFINRVGFLNSAKMLNSHNRVVQAYPLRNAILENNNDEKCLTEFNSSVLNFDTVSNKIPTHEKNNLLKITDECTIYDETGAKPESMDSNTSEFIVIGYPSINKVFAKEFFINNTLSENILNGIEITDFGYSVSIGDNFIAVGCPSYNSERGVVFIYTINAEYVENISEHRYRITPFQTIEGTVEGSRFGHSISLSKGGTFGDRYHVSYLIVGAPMEYNIPNNTTNAGAVYTFESELNPGYGRSEFKNKTISDIVEEPLRGVNSDDKFGMRVSCDTFKGYLPSDNAVTIPLLVVSNGNNRMVSVYKRSYPAGLGSGGEILPNSWTRKFYSIGTEDDNVGLSISLEIFGENLDQSSHVIHKYKVVSVGRDLTSNSNYITYWESTDGEDWQQIGEKFYTQTSMQNNKDVCISLKDNLIGLGQSTQDSFGEVVIYQLPSSPTGTFNKLDTYPYGNDVKNNDMFDFGKRISLVNFYYEPFLFENRCLFSVMSDKTIKSFYVTLPQTQT